MTSITVADIKREIEKFKKENQECQASTLSGDLYDRGYYAGKIELAYALLMFIEKEKT